MAREGKTQRAKKKFTSSKGQQGVPRRRRAPPPPSHPDIPYQPTITSRTGRDGEEKALGHRYSQRAAATNTGLTPSPGSSIRHGILARHGLLQPLAAGGAPGAAARLVGPRRGAPLRALHLRVPRCTRPAVRDRRAGPAVAPRRRVHGHRLRQGDQGQRAAQLHPQGPEREARVAEQVQGQARGGLLLPRRRDARMHQTGVRVPRLLREVQEGRRGGAGHQRRRHGVAQGVLAEVPAAVHAAERRGEPGAQGVGRARGPVRDAPGAADLRAGQERRRPVHLQQPVPTREAHRRDPQDPAGPLSQVRIRRCTV